MFSAGNSASTAIAAIGAATTVATSTPPNSQTRPERGRAELWSVWTAVLVTILRRVPARP